LPGAPEPASRKHESAWVKELNRKAGIKLQQWVGIDVSSKALEVFVRASQRVLNVGNSSAGLATLVTELLAFNAALIVVRAMSGPAHADIEVHIDWLDKRLARLDAELEHLISNNPVWKDLSEVVLGTRHRSGGVGDSWR
jgi:hypothetical protein